MLDDRERSHRVEGRADIAAAGLDDLERLAGGTGHGPAAGLDDGRLLDRDRDDGVAQVGLVVEPHGRDGGHVGGPGVGGIQPTSEAHLDDRDIDPPTGGPEEGRRREQLELGGRPERGLPRRAGAQDLLEEGIEGIRLDGLPVDGHALALAREVRARRLARGQARRPEDGGHHGRHAALPVRAADEDAAQRGLRVAQLGEQRTHALESKADADVATRPDARQRVAGHVRRRPSLPRRRRTG